MTIRKISSIIKILMMSIVFQVLTSPLANSLVIPFGPQNDISLNTVINDWGWSECYSATYNTLFVGGNANQALSNCEGDYLMLAARRTGSSMFEVLAASDRSGVLSFSNNDSVAHASNGSVWYYSPFFSWGFAGENDNVIRQICDRQGLAERDRLCWSTDTITGDRWDRAGTFVGLGNSAAWEKVILVPTQIAETIDVSEPATLGLLTFAIAGIGFFRIRRVKK